MMSQAVQIGLSQRLKASYPQKNNARRATPNHFERKAFGQERCRRPRRRPKSRNSMKGQAMQKKLPAARSATTTNARQYVQGSTPARFAELTCGPDRPSTI